MAHTEKAGLARSDIDSLSSNVKLRLINTTESRQINGRFLDDRKAKQLCEIN